MAVPSPVTASDNSHRNTVSNQRIKDVHALQARLRDPFVRFKHRPCSVRSCPFQVPIRQWRRMVLHGKLMGGKHRLRTRAEMKGNNGVLFCRNASCDFLTVYPHHMTKHAETEGWNTHGCNWWWE